MPTIMIETRICAPRERCFDLARSVDAHLASTADTGERAVGGVTHGLLELGDQVTWEAKHLGVRQRLTARVTQLERPTLFVDEMVSGAFRSFTHRHEFEPCSDGTLMRDVFSYQAPLGALGRVAEGLFLTRYMRRFLVKRATILKTIAEDAAP
ncbi:MAG: SRPBCC family protein [Polyangiaceae bacterium]